MTRRAKRRWLEVYSSNTYGCETVINRKSAVCKNVTCSEEIECNFINNCAETDKKRLVVDTMYRDYCRTEVVMIASDLLHSGMVECEEELATLFHTAAASLFPMLSFGPHDVARKQLQAEEIVWIEGTVTVSF